MPCKFFVSMFGFEPLQRDVTASASALTFDLTLQTRATLAGFRTFQVHARCACATAHRKGMPWSGPCEAGGGGRGGFGGGPGRAAHRWRH